MSSDCKLSPCEIVNSFIDKQNPAIPLAAQADMLGISRGSLYYTPAPIDEKNIVMMNAIDEAYTAHPFYGSRRIAKYLSRQTEERINRKRIQRLMQIMGIEAVYPKPKLSENNQQHPVYPYLLKGLAITKPNEVWGADITYIRMERGFAYLVAIIDWFSRFVVSWNMSTTLEASFCISALKQAIQNFAPPLIHNSDQGSQFTSSGYLKILEQDKIKISMDGRGRCMDNIFTERLWRSVKYEEVYLKDYETVKEAKEQIDNYFNFYNNERIHQSLNYKTPAEIYFQQ